MKHYPNDSFANVDLTVQGERIAFARGVLACYAWAQGMEHPSTCGALKTGNERVLTAALFDAIDLAGEDVEHEHADRVEHCLTTVREAIRIAIRDAVHANMV